MGSQFDMPTSKSTFDAILWHLWGYEASSGFCASLLISGLILTCSLLLVGAVYDYGWTTFVDIVLYVVDISVEHCPYKKLLTDGTWVPQHMGLERPTPHSSESILSDMSLIFTIW